MKRIITSVLLAALLLSLTVLSVSASNPPEPDATKPIAVAIKGTPVIDGTLDEIWKEADVNVIGTYDYVKKDTILTESVANFRVMWDETYLYLYIHVDDTTMADAAWETISNNWYNKDGAAFTFAPDYNRDATTTQVAPAFWGIIRAYGTTANYNKLDSKVFISEDEDPTAANATKMYATKVLTDPTTNALTGYEIECKFNLKLCYADMKMAAGTLIGFDMYINDNAYTAENKSTARDHGYTWADLTTNSYKNNSLKGTIQLIEETPDTGDNTSVIMLSVIAAVSITGLALTACLIYRKKRNQQV